MRFILKTVGIALALWITTLLIPHIRVTSYERTTAGTVLTFLLIAVIFGLVNAIIGGFIRVVAFPLYILTLGLVSLLVNGFLVIIVAWISTQMGFGLVVDSYFWGVVGAVVIAVLSWLIGLVLRPKKEK
ncbi:MAG TPA: phage holin family protein [Candidatus Lumbricidophila sp.]|nr:phage holin family protein [Candidatus Lumbricidophila sp.]